jgi:V8-like Glu-specific endopeptidase
MFWGRKSRKFGDPKAFFGLKEDLPPGDKQGSKRIKDIIGEDTRAPVEDTLVSPFKHHGLIYGKNREKDRAATIGTGWLAGPDTFVTAAHVIFDPTKYWNDGLPKITKIWLALNGIENPPVPVKSEKRIIVHERYTRDQTDIDHDIAIVKLKEPVDGRYGWLPFGNGLSSDQFMIAGYPGDIQASPTRAFVGQGRRVRVDGNRLYHAVDTEKGQSGAPVIVGGAAGNEVVALHTRGGEQAVALGLEANMALLLDGDLGEWIKSFT